MEVFLGADGREHALPFYSLLFCPPQSSHKTYPEQGTTPFSHERDILTAVIQRGMFFPFFLSFFFLFALISSSEGFGWSCSKGCAAFLDGWCRTAWSLQRQLPSTLPRSNQFRHFIMTPSPPRDQVLNRARANHIHNAARACGGGGRRGFTHTDKEEYKDKDKVD